MTSIERARDIAQWTLDMDPATLPEAAVTQAKHLVLDTIGCALAALAEEEAPLICEAVEAMGGAPQATLMGRNTKTSAAGAALANGALLRFLDLNDFLMDNNNGASIGGHPSDNIGPALAVAEWQDVSGLEAIGAIAACYEIFSRLNSMLDRSNGWDSTSVSAFAVAATSARMMGLDADAAANAVALAASRAATPGVVRGGNISAAKYLANAMIAHTAIECAVMAAYGLTGPLQVMEHARGLGSMFHLDGTEQLFKQPIKDPCSMLWSSIKAYPCLATGQTVATAAIPLAEKVKGRLDDIKTITITMADNPMIRRQQTDPGRVDPQSREAADHSFPFIAAVSLMDGMLTTRQYLNERWNAPEIRSLMDRMVFDTDPALSTRAPGGYPSAIRIVMTDGEAFSAEALEAPGMSHGGIPRDAVVSKFELTTAGLLADDRRTKVRDMVLDLENLPSIRPLMAELAAPITT
jgi:2-methylcitrate dehydratase